MRHYFYILTTILLCAGLVLSGSKTANKITAADELKMNDVSFRPAVMNNLNKVIDDLDTLFSLTGGAYADSLYKTAVKAVRVRGQWGYIDSITADTIYGKYVKARRARLDTNIGGDTIYSRIFKGRRARLDTIQGADTVYSRVVLTTRLRADSANVPLMAPVTIDSIYSVTGVKSLRSRSSYLISDSVSIAGGANIKGLTIIDGTTDTFSITVGAKTWKFLPVADK